MVEIIYRVNSEYLCHKESVHVYMRIKTCSLLYQYMLSMRIGKLHQHLFYFVRNSSSTRAVKHLLPSASLILYLLVNEIV
ncbi:unnamed protein product [Brassica rapa subsp. trilocularis]